MAEEKGEMTEEKMGTSRWKGGKRAEGKVAVKRVAKYQKERWRYKKGGKIPEGKEEIWRRKRGKMAEGKM